jgi:NDP-sugar pyrophosphorylase family protein
MDIAIVFMVAGMSSRFGGKAKQFAIVGPDDETLIEYSMKEAISAGINKIIFVTGKKTDSLFKDKFGDMYNGVKIHYAKQDFDELTRERPWGTADALCSAHGAVDSSFIICNGDDIYEKKDFQILVEHLKNNEFAATMGYKLGDVIPTEGKTNRGIFSVDNENNIIEIKEVLGIDSQNLDITLNTESDLCSMNLFGLHKETLNHLKEKLDTFKMKFEGDRKAECFLPVELSNLIKEGKIRMKLYEAKGKWFGVTNPEDEHIVKQQLKMLNK